MADAAVVLVLTNSQLLSFHSLHLRDPLCPTSLFSLSVLLESHCRLRLHPADAFIRRGARRRRHRPSRRPRRVRLSSASSLSSARGDPREAAVAELLRDHGASPEDAAAIAARAGVRSHAGRRRQGLDELGLWASWSAGAGALGFGRKMYFMGRSRRDGAVVPLVKSLGVRLSSAKLIAPYVAAEGLPVLILRVKFLKEMLFSSSGYETLIGRNAKRMMAHLSIPADEALQSTLSFFGKRTNILRH